MILALILNHALAGWGFVELAKAVIIVVAVCAVVYVIVKAMGMTIPQWLIVVFMIVVAAVVGLVAINVLASI